MFRIWKIWGSSCTRRPNISNYLTRMTTKNTCEQFIKPPFSIISIHMRSLYIFIIRLMIFPRMFLRVTEWLIHWKITPLKLSSTLWTIWAQWRIKLVTYWTNRSMKFLELSFAYLALNKYYSNSLIKFLFILYVKK